MPMAIENHLSRRSLRTAGLLAGAAVLLLPAVCLSQVDITPGYRLEYRVVAPDQTDPFQFKISESAESIVSFTNYLTQRDLDGEPAVVLEREERLSTGVTILWTFIMDTERMGLMRVEKKVISPSGRVVREAYADYRDPMFNYPPNTAHLNTIANVIQVMPLYCDCRHDFYLTLSMDLPPWHILATVETIESVTVPAGTFDCYRVRIEPDYQAILGKWAWGARVFKSLVPEYHFWMDTHAPHHLVKFRGKFGPEGAAPVQIWELTKINSPA